MNPPPETLILLALSRIEGNVAKLDEQMQTIRTALTELQGGVQALLEADEEEDEDETDDEATQDTTEDDDSASDMSFVVEDHSSSSASYDTDWED
jgi:hypothetical protein